MEKSFLGALALELPKHFAASCIEHELRPNGIHRMPGVFKNVSPFLEAKLEHVAPGAPAQKLGLRRTLREVAAQRRPAGDQFLARGFDLRGGLFAKLQRILIVRFSALLALPGSASRTD